MTDRNKLLDDLAMKRFDRALENASPVALSLDAGEALILVLYVQAGVQTVIHGLATPDDASEMTIRACELMVRIEEQLPADVLPLIRAFAGVKE